MENTSEQEISPAVKAHPNHLPWILGGLGLGILLLCGLSIAAGFLLVYFSGTPLHGTQITFQAQPVGGKQLSSEDMKQTVAILKARAKSSQVASYSIRVSGTDQIVVRLPKDEKQEDLVKSLSQIGIVEFVDMGNDCLPDGTRITTDFSPSLSGQKPVNEKIYHTILIGEQIDSVAVTTETDGRYLISFELKPDGKNILYEYSKNNIDKCLAVVLDKMIITDPKMNSPIPDGRAIIEGNMTEEDANHIASLMKTTPLPVELKVVKTKDY